jgi:hypothetical protein
LTVAFRIFGFNATLTTVEHSGNIRSQTDVDPQYLDEPRDERGRWTAGGSGPSAAKTVTAPAPDRMAGDRQDALNQLAPGRAARMDYGIDGAVPHLAAGVRDRVAGYLDRGGRSDLGTVLEAFSRGSGMSDEHFRDAFGLNASVTGSVLQDLRRAAAGIEGAQTVEAMKAASGALADALAAIGPSSLGTVIGGAKSGVAKLDKANLDKMAGILQAEAGSLQDRPAMEAIGHTILNRMQRNGTALVADVAGGYAKLASPDSQTIALAVRLLDGTSPDPTGGATHFYSPQSSPKEGQPVPKGADIKGGLESVAGVTGNDRRTPVRNYRPGWTTRFQPSKPTGIPPAIAKFYIDQDLGRVH